MKRFVTALAIAFILSAVTSVVAAMGMQRIPDRSPPRMKASLAAATYYASYDPPPDTGSGAPANVPLA
ncbi:MAG: hypothetical protein FWH06_07015, partial [Oscillospiraceae bacterium]|nr:hypothetical protein [Oscillospiraceae bacterium]